MKEIILLTDYKGFFGSKQKSDIYRGGMDIPKLINLFQLQGYSVKALNFCHLNLQEVLQTQPIIIYTSAEDKNGIYKSFIEDIIYSLEEHNVMVLPRYSYLKAHNNKVFMELLRGMSDYGLIKTIHSHLFGSLEELELNLSLINYPVVIKSSSGAMSRGVAKAKNAKELIKIARKISTSQNLFHDIKELLRSIKYRKNYIRESFHRNKFIVQNFISGLNNDWKVLVYNNKCFVLYRSNRKNDFRASGSGKFEFRKDLPDGLLDFALSIRDYFTVPQISLDIGYDGKNFHLIEFQFLHFGTTTIEKSMFYFEKIGEKWNCINGKSDLEEVYVQSIVGFIKEHYS